jgi:hypothetical protein
MQIPLILVKLSFASLLQPPDLLQLMQEITKLRGRLRLFLLPGHRDEVAQLLQNLQVTEPTLQKTRGLVRTGGIILGRRLHDDWLGDVEDLLLLYLFGDEILLASA